MDRKIQTQTQTQVEQLEDLQMKQGSATALLIGLPILRRWFNNDGLRGVWRKIAASSFVQSLFRAELINLGEDGTKGAFDICGIQCGGFNKTECVGL